MPIKLDGEKILITEGDQNYELERVKSYGYRDLSQETTQPPTITPTIQAEDITPEILTYKHDGSSNDQTTHSVTFDEDVVVDILIVGGGGAGGGGQGTGTGGGGGGGGQVRLIQSLEVNSGTSYEIKVGKGGTGLFNASYATGNKGNDSSFDTYISLGGGGGGVRDLNASATYTGGGAGGYGGSRGIGTGYSGGTGGANGSADRGAGGGAGSGGNGGNYSGDNGGDGGIGLDRIGDYIFAENFGTNYGYLEGGTTWFGGGGGGSGESLSGTNGIGKHGGSNGNNSTGISEDALWGGGSGGIALLNANTDYDGDGSNDHKVGNGGSGIVIIKIHRDITHKKVVLKYDYKEDKKYPTIAADTTNLLAHYKFDDDTNKGLNSSVSSNSIGDAGYNGTPTLNTTEYVIGKSSYFSGSGDHSFVLDDNSDNLYNAIYQKPITIAFWLKSLSAGQVNQGRVFYGSPTGSSNNTNAIQCWHRDGSSELSFIIVNNGESNTGNYMNTTLLPPFNTAWSHVAFVVEPQSTNWTTKEHMAKIYVNGVLDQTYTNIWYPLITQNYDFEIGRWTTNEDSREYDGYLDDFRIYDKALSETEIADLYKQSIVARFRNPSNSSAVAASKDWKLISYEPTGNNWFPDGLLNDIPSDRYLAFIYEDSGTYTWVMLQKSVIEGNHNWSTYSVPTGHGSISSIGRYNDEQTTGSHAPIITTTTNVQSSSDFIYREESSSTWHPTPPANRRYYVLEEVIQTEYTISFPTPRLCDILIVGGGGAAGTGIGGGGGAGGVVYIQNYQMSANTTYKIKVGNGGINTGIEYQVSGSGHSKRGVSGYNSGIYNSDDSNLIYTDNGANFPLIGYGGGGGGAYSGNLDTEIEPASGGSSGGMGCRNTYDRTMSSAVIATQGNTYWNGTTFVPGGYLGGNIGRQGLAAAGGGGAGGAGQAAPDGENGGDGGAGIVNDITGVQSGYAGGGGGSTDSSTSTNMGRGGSVTIYGVTMYLGGDGIPYGTSANQPGGDGLANTGSGGGGGGWSDPAELPGNGGSGIVIIRYRAYGIKYDAQWKHHRKLPNIHFYGNVGIGTYANNNKLYVNGSVNVTGDYYKNNRTLTEWHNSTNGNIYKNYGNVGIGSATPNYKLHVEGQIYAAQGGTSGSGNTAWTSTSDMRVKDNITKASYIKCYNNINNIELYRFNYKPVLNNTRDINQLGFIAQEVERIFPKSVKRNKMILNEQEQEILALDVTQINYTLFGAVKYLAEKVEALKQKVNKIN